jgi:hypothetical protein
MTRGGIDPAADTGTKVKRPTHVLYYRIVQPGLVEVVRVLTNAGRTQPASPLSASFVLVSQPRHDRVDVCVAEAGFVEGGHLLLGPFSQR